MKPSTRGNLRLRSNVVELLLPQKRPFLMVDGVESFQAEPVPVLEAFRHISGNDPVFDGHFAGLHVWPGAFTIEGLGQTGVLLVTVVRMRKAVEAEGHDPELALEALRNLERGFRLERGFQPEAAAEVVRRVRAGQSGIAVGTSVDMKFAQPVFGGQRLDYRVALTGDHGGGVRFECEASVEDRVVASGVMMGALVQRPVLPGA